MFGPGDWEIDQAWCGDVTYVRTWQGWAYLATVIDLANCRVIGWALADNMATDLVADAYVWPSTLAAQAPGCCFIPTGDAIHLGRHSDGSSPITGSSRACRAEAKAGTTR